MGSTIVWLQEGDPPPNLLSMVASLALYEALLACVSSPATLQLKWPNDVLLDGAKCCGILLERVNNHVVVGIGVNLANVPQIEGRKVSAMCELGPTPDRDGFARDLAAKMRTETRNWRAYGNGKVRERWLAAAHPQGSRLRVHEENGEQAVGSFIGIGDDGSLHLRLEDGSTRVIYAGDVMQEEG